MHVIVPPESEVRRLGLLPGTFNPPTRAHLALAEAALTKVDEVLLVLPGVLPHKIWEGAAPHQRLEMLRRVTSTRPRIGAAAAEGGLFEEIAREARLTFPSADIYMICGRDAAERIVGWDYGEPDAISRQLQQFRLLVANRGGMYEPPEHLNHAIECLSLESYEEYTSTSIRQRSDRWRDLVPDEIAHMVGQIYLEIDD